MAARHVVYMQGSITGLSALSHVRFFIGLQQEINLRKHNVEVSHARIKHLYNMRMLLLLILSRMKSEKTL